MAAKYGYPILHSLSIMNYTVKEEWKIKFPFKKHYNSELIYNFIINKFIKMQTE